MAVLAPEPRVLPAANEQPTASRRWLVGPGFDLFFLANIAWPLLLLKPFTDGLGGSQGVQFWQLYFVTTPHRWITLLIVFTDRDRFRERRGTFLMLALAAVVVCLGVRLTTGTLTCLLAVDYVWNAWHFAAQHHGIYRIYGRLAAPSPSAWVMVEKWALRLFLLYVILRVASATWADGEIHGWLRQADWLALLLPALVLGRLVISPSRLPIGGIVYLVSVLLLFLAMLWAVHLRRPGLVLTLATASALFHAIEYLAIVTWSVRRRHDASANQMGILAAFVPRWGLALGVFVLILGSGGYLLDQGWLDGWLLLNIIAAFLHYAYDGLIWRRGPAPQTAA